MSVFTTPGGNDEVVHVFLARGLSRLDDAHPREAEEADIRIEWMPLADAVTEGKKVVTGMLIVGLIFIGVIAVGETVHWLRRRRATSH